jgi:hypothetical protein
MGKVGKSLVPYMTYEQVKRLKQEDFKRLCGVRPETFNQMLEVVRSGDCPRGTALCAIATNVRQGDLLNSTWKTSY